MWDTGEDEDIRKSSYPGADAVMICFSVERRGAELTKTLKSLAKEAAAHCKLVFLIGTKTELREAKGKVSKAEKEAKDDIDGCVEFNM